MGRKRKAEPTSAREEKQLQKDEDELKETVEEDDHEKQQIIEISSDIRAMIENTQGPQRGRSGSRRSWKDVAPKNSSAIKVPALHSTWKQKQLERDRRRAAKQRHQELKAELQAEADAERERRAEKKRRREANELKSSVYQPITNVNKIKRMTKKQMRSIKKI